MEPNFENHFCGVVDPRNQSCTISRGDHVTRAVQCQMFVSIIIQIGLCLILRGIYHNKLVQYACMLQRFVCYVSQLMKAVDNCNGSMFVCFGRVAVGQYIHRTNNGRKKSPWCVYKLLTFTK